MKISAAEFRAAAATLRAVPAALHPEVAIAGRSNVGKSSLINRMTGRRDLARTSRTPGCTRGLIFYDVNDAMTLVDLPGYGYASRSQTERRRWKGLVEGYLATREELAGVLILVDCRRGLEEEELQLAEYLSSVGVAYAVVVTKADKLGRSALSRQLASVHAQTASEEVPVMATSAHAGSGVDSVWRWIHAAVATEPQR